MAHASTVVLGTGSYAPARILTNDELSRTVETSDEWIRTRTGIRERRIAAPGETTSDLAAAAGRAALADAGLAPGDIDLLIVATVTPDMPMPAAACLVQHKLGLRTDVPCFDINAACSGFLYALDVASAMLASGRYARALIIGAEKLSSVLDWTDRATCVLFGDGAGAVVLGRSEQPGIGLLGTKLGAAGNSADLLCIAPRTAGPVATSPAADFIASHERVVHMKGREVFKLAVRAMDESARDILEQHRLHADQIALVIPHQANLRIIDAISQYLELPLGRFFVNVDRYGNTSAASIPLALDEARRAGRIHPGDVTLLVAFGAGLTYGSALIRW
jgi:3-oxoacyl-[acyl-carrier-protein] synthase III